MNKKIFTALILTSILAAPAFCADNFNKRLSICNPYKTEFTASNGQVYEKSVMGAHLDVETGLRSCVFYTQVAQNSYKLCNISMSALNRKNIDFSQAKCLMTDVKGLESMKRELAAGNYYTRRAIINRMH